MLKSPYRWVVLNITKEEHTDESCQNLAGDLSEHALAEGKVADADIVLVCRGVDSLILVDLWGHEKPTLLGRWVPDVKDRFRSDRHPPTVRRIVVGLNGHVFRTVFVVSDLHCES